MTSLGPTRNSKFPVERVKDEKDLEADMVGFEKGLKARPKYSWGVFPIGSSCKI